jgi:hypothetical protein
MNRSFQQQRQSPRVEVNTPAKVTVIRGLRVSKPIPCVIVNISAGGALLAFQTPILEPDFYLELNGKSVLCTVVRRVGNNVGVKFHQFA